MTKVRRSTLPDHRDPDFDRKMLAWKFQVQCEMHELALITRETIAATKVMITEADKLLAHIHAERFRLS
jgi:hypothetical protein